MDNSLRIFPNFSLSSARSIFFADVPIILAPYSSKSLAIFKGVCPPNWTKTPSGFSKSIIFATSSKVTGSKYNLSTKSKSVLTVSGLQLIIITLYPWSFSPKTACTQQ